ncbi:hypothetical protein CDL15_Pgr016629 [Punica granatum]|uniref:Uncharacterized protein n=1 Tax=Punica granatum TaxID=22663 RepID=A0A218W7M0_PUNGR|nr:hypothetical protein CDL15_Pgr023498 [Punica granatum]OWM88056.1 hypothetical protein CDL15_Pgr016629 [Punica granatum]
MAGGSLFPPLDFLVLLPAYGSSLEDARVVGVIAAIDQGRLGDAADGVMVSSENGRPVRVEL